MDLSILLSPIVDPAHARTCLESLTRTLPPKLDWELLAFGPLETPGVRPDRFHLLSPLPDSAHSLAASRNAAAAAARTPLLCFVSPGIVFMPGWLSPMLESFRRAPAAGCVGNVQREPYSGLIDHAGIRLDADGLPAAFWANQPLLPRELRAWHPAVSLSCALVSRELFDAVNGFDERFQGPLGDVDFCLRAASLQRRRHYVANRSVVYGYHDSLPDPAPAADLALYRSRWGSGDGAGSLLDPPPP